MTIPKWRAVAILAILYVAEAQTVLNWTQQSPPSSPAARWGHAMAYDVAHSGLIRGNRQ